MTFCKMQTARELSQACKIVRINPNSIKVTVKKPFIDYLMVEIGRVKRG